MKRLTSLVIGCLMVFGYAAYAQVNSSQPRGHSERAQSKTADEAEIDVLIDGSLALDDWVALVRTAQPGPARFEGGLWRRIAAWFRRLRARRRTRRPQLSSTEQ